MTEKMNPTIKARWVAALRSGEYKQAEGVLRDRGGAMCCLGVLCDLYAKERGITPEWSPSQFWREGDEMANDEVCDWAGFPCADLDRFSSEYDPKVIIGDDYKNLSGHNDAGRSFHEIAKAIEEQL